MVEKASEIIESFQRNEGLTGAFAATRSGNFICGVLPEGHHRDTFVAMTAIIHGGAETTAMEMRKHLEHVTIQLSDSQMFITGLGTIGIVAVIGHRIDEAMIGKTKALVKELEPLIH